MNKKLFFDGFINRIKKQFNIEENFAFEIFCMAPFLEMTFQELLNDVSTIVDGSGSNDAGFDGIYLDQEENTLHLFQIKNKNSIGDNELSKFLNDYNNIFVNDNSTNIPLNKRVKASLDQYRNLVSSGKIIDTKLYFIFNGEICPENEERVSRYKKLNPDLEILDSNNIYNRIESLLLEHKKRKTVHFSFMAEKSNISFKNDPQALISFQIQNIKAVNFRLTALALCELLEKEIEINKRIDTVFSDNIRGFLKYNKTNKRIKETLISKDSEYFPFLNNGITIIAEQIKLPQEMQLGFYPIETKNPVIVNGLQTTHVIYDIFKNDRQLLDGVYVLVRLYETNDTYLVDKITDATNTQSPINFADKISTKNFNEITKTFFAQKGINYLIKRGELFTVDENFSYSDTIQSDILLKFWYASYRESPEIAKNSKTKVLEEIYDASINSDHDLFALFNGNKNSEIYEQLYMTYKMYTFVVHMRQKKETENAPLSDFILYSDELMVYGLYKSKSRESDFEKTYETLYSAILSIVKERKKILEDKGLSYSHNGYFKSIYSKTDLDKKMGFISL